MSNTPITDGAAVWVKKAAWAKKESEMVPASVARELELASIAARAELTRLRGELIMAATQPDCNYVGVIRGDRE